MNYLKSIALTGIPLLILSFITSLLYYFNLLNPNVYKYLKLIIPLILLFTGSHYLGKHSKQKGWLEGLKLGAILIISLFFISYLAFNIGFSLKNIIYYLIILFTSMFGSMVGIRNVEK